MVRSNLETHNLIRSWAQPIYLRETDRVI